jgi:hypothetical protein
MDGYAETDLDDGAIIIVKKYCRRCTAWEYRMGVKVGGREE